MPAQLSTLPPRSLCRRSLPLLVLTLAASAPAHAVDGTITITGEISDTTCKINGAEPPHNFLVNLPKISTSALKNVNDTAGATAFSIKITDCPESLNTKTLTAYFEPGATTDFSSGNLRAYTHSGADKTAATSIPSLTSETVAEKVQIQLANIDGSKITMGADATAQAARAATVTDKAATLTYLAQYVRSQAGAITPGKLFTYVQYSIVYP